MSAADLLRVEAQAAIAADARLVRLVAYFARALPDRADRDILLAALIEAWLAGRSAGVGELRLEARAAAARPPPRADS